ncbi:MAG: hypothetical protein GXO76_13040 [Calditrichaeota bacterium]|nr:hypothetical protein [Calditrichota bacterium]
MVKKLLTLGVLFAIVFWVVIPSFAQQKKNIPNAEISEELEIMKGVLKEMLSDSKKDFFSSNSIEGIYLPDYGIVFDVKAPKIQIEAMRAQYELLQSQQKAINESLEAIPLVIKEMQDALPSVLKEFNKGAKSDSLRQLLKKKKQTLPRRLEEMRKANRARRAAKLEKIKAGIEKNKQSFREFLEDYADVGDLLLPKQKITIFYDWDFDLNDIAVLMPAVFTVKKSDILSFRSGKITESQFWAKVQKGSRPSEEVQKQLEIMKRIFKTGLKTVVSNSWGMGSLEAHVLPRYGVWFNMGNAQLGLPSIPFSFASDKSVRAKSNAKQQKAVRKYYERIIQLVGQYGFSLRFLKPEEWVVVTFHSNGFLNRLGPDLYLLRVKKADIEDLHKKNITFRDFQKRVEVREFR